MKLEPYTEELRGCPVKGNAYPVLVLGIGNPLMGDDGAGVELAHRLQERDYGPLVHVEEGGTQGMTLLPLLEDADTLILLDGIQLKKPINRADVFVRPEIVNFAGRFNDQIGRAHV